MAGARTRKRAATARLRVRAHRRVPFTNIPQREEVPMSRRRACVVTLLLGGVLMAKILLAGTDEGTPNQQALKTDLLVVTAHPDDESMMAPVMARYADEGKVVALA